MSMKILLNNALWSTISHILSRGILMLSGILLARYLSPKDFALYSYFQITATMLATYSALGLGVAASKYFAEFSINKDNKEVIDTISTLLGIALVISILATVIILLIPNKILSSGLNISNTTFALAVLVLSLNIIPSGAVLGLEKYKQATFFSLMNGLICLLGVFLSISFNKVNYSIFFFILAYLAQLIGYLFITYKEMSFLPLKNMFRIKKSVISNLSKFIGPLVFVSLLTASSGWILGKSLLEIYGEHVFAAYSIGLQWFSLALFIPGMISRVVLPRLIRSEVNNKSVLKTACLLAFGFSIFIFLIGSLFKEEIILFYGNSYSEYEYVLVSFLFIAVIYAPANTLGNAIVAKLGSFHWFIITICWFICLMLTFFLRVRQDGILAVIYAQILSTLILLVISYILCRKKGLI